MSCSPSASANAFSSPLTDDTVRAAVEFAAKMPQGLKGADFVYGFTNPRFIQTVLQARVEADLEVGRRDLPCHAERIGIALDDRSVVLQREDHAELAGESRCFRERLAAPVPGLLVREVAMLGLPDRLRNVVAASARGDESDARPCQKDAQDFGAEVGGHAHQFAQIDQLTFPMLGDGAAEIVVARHRVNLKPLVGSQLPNLPASGFRHIQRVAVGALAIDLDTVVAELPRTADYLFQGKGIAPVPDATVGDAVKTDFDLSARRRGRLERAGSQSALHEPAA